MSKADASSLEIIPDSEEERAVSHTTHNQRFTALNSPETGRRDIAGPREIIYISSDEDEDGPIPQRRLPATPKPKRRPIIPVEEILELTDSEEEKEIPRKAAVKPLEPVVLPAFPVDGSELDDDSDHQDDSTLVYPGSARKAVRLDITRKDTPDTPGTKLKSRLKHLQEDESPSTPKRKTPSTKAKTPRTGKKAKEAAERERLLDYAKDWFKRLNREVFDMKLPEDTDIIWNAKLISSAGRAHFKRVRDQQGNATFTCKVDMATKIVDSEERIRNTLSHELCHLACWVIDGKLDEGHGRLWKSWIHRVMKKLPHVEITSKHSYDMNYPFTWECLKCGKIYGRWSKSIKVEQHGCGEPGCKGARLKALFETRTRTAKTPDSPLNSNQLSNIARDSPKPLAGGEPSRLRAENEDDDHSEFEVEELTTKLGSIGITSSHEDPFQ